MDVKDFSFDLPDELIAQEPLSERSASRLLVMDRLSGKIAHRQFTDILELLSPADCLVVNNTKVMPARLFGKGGDRDVEFLLLNRHTENIWETLVKPGKWAKKGDSFSFGKRLEGYITEVKEDGNRLIKFEFDGIFEEILDELGEMPLPPYITKKLADKDRYQTVYAKETGSAAAPTAGLHFTEELLRQILARGVKIAYVTLHVGLGTFRPVKVDNVEDHKMHAEYYILEASQAQIMNETRQNGGKIIAVGTTSMRTLESCADDSGLILPKSGYTDIFIYPGYTFKGTDSLITNFHLPESTLIMLVSAFSSREHILNAYSEAIKERYRFFSFGDAMFLKGL